MSIKVDHTNTKCYRCGNAETTQGFGSPRWYRYYDEKELSGKHMLKIVKNKKRWEDFRIDEKPYDEHYGVSKR